jgi:hypothetical protein
MSLRDAGALFVGATRYTGPLAWLRLPRRWTRMIRQAKRMPGYVHHQVYYERPFTLGTIGFFDSPDALRQFARTGGHRDLMVWVVDRRNASGGYIRVYRREGADAQH